MSFSAAWVQRHFDRAAATYDEAAQLQRVVLARVLAQAQTHFPSSGLILDAGCGTGEFSRRACEAPGWQVVGMDLALGMCRAAHERGMRAVGGDAQCLPFAAESFHGLILSLTLQWLNDRPAFFREARRVLKPGGKAVISSFGPGTLTELKHSFAMLDKYDHISRFAPLSEWAKEAGEGLEIIGQAQEMLVYDYPDVPDLLRSLKAIGATHKQEGRRKGLMAPSVMARMQEAYRRNFATAQGIQASWEIEYLMLEKVR